MSVPTTTLTRTMSRIARTFGLASAPQHADHALVRRLVRTFEPRRDFDGLRFYVRQGVVTIFGTLDTPSQRAVLDGTVRSIPGVQGVHLQVQFVHTDAPEVLPELGALDSSEPAVDRARPMRRRRPARLAIAGA